MEAARWMPLDGPTASDPQVDAAVNVYDSLNDEERRTVFETMVRAIAAYRRTSNIDHMAALAESIEGLIRLSAQPGYWQAMRDLPDTPPAADEGIELEEAIKRLRE